VRVLLDLYTNDGQFLGWVRAAHDADPVWFSGVLELLAVLELLRAEPLPDDVRPPGETEVP
jgi:hypothetical protein